MGNTISPAPHPPFARIADWQRTVSAAPQRQDPCFANWIPAVRPARWVAGLLPRRVARAESQLEAREESCVDASVFTFTRNGETTVFNVPEGSTGQVVDLAAKEDYEGLKALSKDWQCRLERFLPLECRYCMG